MKDSCCRVPLARITRSAIALWGALVLAGLAGYLGTGRMAWAQTPKLAASGPSNSAPRNLLSPNLPDAAESLREQAAELLQRVYDRQQQAPDKAGVATYEEIYVDLLRLGWLGLRLQALGEPLGVDITKRVDQLDRWVKSEIIAAAARAELKNDVTRRVVSLERAHELADKKLSRRINDLYQKSNYIDAYEAFIEVTAPVEAQGQWYEAVKSSKHPKLERWSGLRRQYVATADREAKELAVSARLALYKNFKTDPQSLIDQVSSAARDLAAAPQMQLPDGRMVSGPEALDHFFQAWVTLQNKAVRAEAYRQIAQYCGDAARPNLDPKAYAQACNKIVAGLAGLIEADAERSSGDEAADLYLAYLDELPMLISRCNNASVAATFGGPLQKLAAKSPLNDRVEAYRARTDELLRWRRRAAAAYLRSVSDVFRAAAPLGTLSKIRQPVPDMVAAVSDTYLDKKVSADKFLAIDPGAADTPSTYAVSDISNRLVFFATIPHDQLAAVGEAFRAEMLAADAPPTLEMRLALYRLKKGDFQTAGGTVTRAGFIGVPARFLSSGADNRGLIRLGPVQLDEASVRMDDVMLQLMLDPAWLSDTYWYAPLPAK